MWINTYAGIFVVAVINTATCHILGLPVSPYTSHVTYSAYNPIDYSAPHLLGSYYDYYTGPTSHIEGFPNYFYPGLENLGVEIARKKELKPAGKKGGNKIGDKKDQTKELCETFEDAFSKPGLTHLYSLDNGPLVIRNGFDFNVLPSIASWPFGNEQFWPLYKPDGKGKKGVAKDDSKNADDDITPIDRKINLKVPNQTPEITTLPETIVSLEPSKGSDDETLKIDVPSDNTGENADSQTNSPLPPATDPPASSSSDAADQTNNSGDAAPSESTKKKRQS